MKVIIFYGTDCNDKTAWIPWLNDELTKLNIKCIIPKLPTPKNQTYNSWANITKQINICKDDIIISWSTGAIFAVRYLFENKLKVKKLILISGFNNYIGDVPFVDNINKDFFIHDVGVAKNIADKIVCIKSNNDPFITQQALNDFAEKLNAETINIKNGGHFNADSEYGLKFDELLRLINN